MIHVEKHKKKHTINDTTKNILSYFCAAILKQITLNDIHAFVSYLAVDLKAKPATRARKISSIRIFFKYLTTKSDETLKQEIEEQETDDKEVHNMD